MGPNVTPKLLAQKLSTFTGQEFSEAEMLPYAHALMDLSADDPRREKLWRAILGADEASEKGGFRLVACHDLKSL